MLRPTTEEEVAELLAEADATGQSLIPRGGGTKLGWGRPAQGEFLSVRELDRMIAMEPGDFVCVAQAGMRLADLDAALRAEPGHRQRLMLDPPHGADATLGGIVATNASGPLRHRYGAPRDLVIGARMVLADGTRAKTGGARRQERRRATTWPGCCAARWARSPSSPSSPSGCIRCPRRPSPCCSRRATRPGRRRSRRPSAAGGLTPTQVEVAWPDGRVVARFDSTPAAAREQALAAAALDPDARVLPDSDRRMLVPRLANRPWTGEGAVLRRGRAAGRSRRPAADRRGPHATTSCCGRASASARRGCRPTPTAVALFRDAVVAIGGHVSPRRLPPGLADLTWPEPDAVSRSLTLAIKRQLDPNGTLAPGRLAEAA